MLIAQCCELGIYFFAFLGGFAFCHHIFIAFSQKSKYRNELKLEFDHFAANEQFLEVRWEGKKHFYLSSPTSTLAGGLDVGDYFTDCRTKMKMRL